MRIATEPAEEVVHLFVDHCVVRHETFKFLQLIRGWKIAVKQRKTHFEIVGFFGQLVDRIATVQQFALVAVDKGNRAVAGRRRRKTGIVGEHACLAVQLANIDDVWSSGRGKNWQLIGNAINCQRCGFLFGHVFSLSRHALGGPKQRQRLSGSLFVTQEW